VETQRRWQRAPAMPAAAPIGGMFARVLRLFG
jgi:hypothetical protein